jgi:hypothetical protein
LLQPAASNTDAAQINKLVREFLIFIGLAL